MNNPQRCFSCNKIIGNIWEKYEQLTKENKEFEEICTQLGITRYCCKRMLLSQKNFYDIFSSYIKSNIKSVKIDNVSKHSVFHNTI